MKHFFSLILLSLIVSLATISVAYSQILPERERATLRDEILKDRFDNLLPQLMDDTGIDMWLVIAREYNEDPVMRTMLPATWLNARRRTILVFYRNKEQNTLERLAVARYDVGANITSSWDKEKQPNQWKRLVEIIKERPVEKIGINISKHFGIADGLVKTDYQELMEALPSDLEEKIVSAEKLAIAWIETRTEKEMLLYNQLVDITSAINELKFVKEIHVVATNNEVKELLFLLEKDYHKSITITTVNRSKKELQLFNFKYKEKAVSTYSKPLTYLYEPNSAILKSGGFHQISNQLNIFKIQEHSHLYTSNQLIEFPGRVFKIEQTLLYQKKKIKNLLKNNKANITIRNFPKTVDQIRKETKIKEGGDSYLFFTKHTTEELVVIVCKKQQR